MPDPVSRLSAALSGRYRIERELGRGGMATVYLADDLRHGRKVALKVLQPELAAVVGAERFLAEIRITAKLQHPHILPLHDSGEADGLLFYVMPLVEGESLRERLDRERQLPVDEAVRIATAVAQALDYAHRRGVIHRDIKPANILIHDGEPVVSDFGIAIALSAGGAGRLTETGLSLGTPHYMSPEQATGDTSVGPATDVWALGCVLYELLVGEPPYTGSTPQAVLGRILTSEPESVTAMRRSVPSHVEAVIRRALEKVPADRFASAGEMVRALGDPGFRHAVPVVAPAVGDSGARRWKALALGLGTTALLLAVGLALALTTLSRPEPRAVARFDVTPRIDQPIAPGETDVDFALSPDGTRIVYRGLRPDGGTQLWIRALDQLDAVPLAGTEDAESAVFSPDGRSLAFEVGGAIRTLPVTGGPPVTVLAATGGPRHTLAWGDDGMLYLGLDARLFRVSSSGGEPEALTDEPGLQRFPDALPEGRGVLLTLLGAYPALNRIAVADARSGEVRELLTATMARYAAPGHVVYATADGTLLAAPFELSSLEITGPPVALARGVPVKPSGAAQFALSKSGTLLYATGGSSSELVWVSRTGVVEPIDPSWAHVFSHPALSADGRRLAVTIRSETSMHVWVKQLDRGPSLQLSVDGDLNGYPSWTPDGTSVTFFSNRAGPSFDLYTKRADGSTQAALELDGERALAESAWAPDGSWFVFRTDRGEAGQGNVFALRRGGSDEPIPLLESAFAELSPTPSPDGRWLAYTSNETGREEVYVVPFPDAGAAKWVISIGGGSEPIWARGGGELFYRNGRGEMVSVQVETSPTFVAGERSVLFSASRFRSDLNHPQYDASPDAERFLMIQPAAGDASLVLVVNFLAELRERS
jgi:serine/threonine-protein kinase